MTTNCCCRDPGCPVCHGHCSNHAAGLLYRADRKDTLGTPFCMGCAEDALASGGWDLEPSHRPWWKDIRDDDSDAESAFPPWQAIVFVIIITAALVAIFLCTWIITD